MILKSTWKRRLVNTGIFIVVLIYLLLFVFSNKLDLKEIKEFLGRGAAELSVDRRFG